MKKQVKIALCVSAAVIALVVLFNLLPSGIRTTATLCAGLGGRRSRRRLAGKDVV